MEFVTDPCLPETRNCLDNAFRHMVGFLGLSWAAPGAGLVILVGPFLPTEYPLGYPVILHHLKTTKTTRHGGAGERPEKDKEADEESGAQM